MAISAAEVAKKLDLAWRIRQMGKRMIPHFRGPSGIGKSETVEQWCDTMAKKIKGFGMIDFRGATVDSSDMRGLPWKDEKTGSTVFLPPDFLPREGAGVLFIDEINRSPTPVQNCFMELFTRRRIGNYILPDGWLIVTASNPDNGSYDVNPMDPALENRVTTYDVRYDHKATMAYAKRMKWSPHVINFLGTGEWVYKEPGNGDEHYISPRSWEYLSDAELAGSIEDPDGHSDDCVAYLGKNMGNQYWAFCHKTKPVLYDEIDKEFGKAGRKADKIMDLESIKAFAAYADPTTNATIRGDLVSSTVQSILNKAEKGAQHVDETILYAVVNILPADQAVALIQSLALKASDPPKWVIDAKKKYANVYSRLRTSVVKEGVKTDGQQ